MKNLQELFDKAEKEFDAIYQPHKIIATFCKDNQEVALVDEHRLAERDKKYEGVPKIVVSPTLIEKILETLLQNAQKHGAEPYKILIKEENNGFLLSFSNEGKSDKGFGAIQDEKTLMNRVESSLLKYIKEYQDILAKLSKELSSEKLGTVALVATLLNAQLSVKHKGLKYTLHKGWEGDFDANETTVTFEILFPDVGGVQ